MAATGLRERNRAAAMHEVRHVALGMMAATGYDAVKVEDVASAAGVSPSTIYRYFGTKDALVLDVDRPARFVTTLGTSGEGAPLDRLLAAAIETFAGDADLATELDLVVADEALTTAFERQWADRRGEVAAVLADQRGASSTGLRDDAVAAAAVAVIVTTVLRWHRSGADKSLKKTLTKAFAALR